MKEGRVGGLGSDNPTECVSLLGHRRMVLTLSVSERQEEGCEWERRCSGGETVCGKRQFVYFFLSVRVGGHKGGNQVVTYGAGEEEKRLRIIGEEGWVSFLSLRRRSLDVVREPALE